TGRASQDGSTQVALALPKIGFASVLGVVHGQVPGQFAKPNVNVASIRSQRVGILIRRSLVVHLAKILKDPVRRIITLDTAETACANINRAVVSDLRPLRTFLAQRGDVLSFPILRVMHHEVTRVAAAEVKPVAIKTRRIGPGTSKDPICKEGTTAR